MDSPLDGPVELTDELIAAASRSSRWTFFTNHAHVLIAISRDSELRQREIAWLVGITEGAVQKILDDLERDGYLTRERVGRRNRYHPNLDLPLRHPLERHRTIADVLDTVNQLAGG